jgi:hypothetical protein
MAAPQGIIPAVRSPAASAVIANPGASPPQIHGGPANPAHGQYTWEGSSQWMPWEVIPGGHALGDPQAAWALVSDVPPSAPAGQDPDAYANSTMTLSHGAPWPHEHIANIGDVSDIQAAADQARANAALHSIDSGDPASFTMQPTSTHVEEWQRFGYVSAGVSGLELPGRQMIGNANTGFRRDSGWTAEGENLNRFGMDSAHVGRYRATGDIPVPPNSTQGAQRPLSIAPASSRNYPVGEGSPFEGQTPGVGADFSVGFTGLASDYQASPDPPTGPSLYSTQPADPVPWGADFLG